MAVRHTKRALTVPDIAKSHLRRLLNPLTVAPLGLYTRTLKFTTTGNNEQRDNTHGENLAPRLGAGTGAGFFVGPLELNDMAGTVIQAKLAGNERPILSRQTRESGDVERTDGGKRPGKNSPQGPPALVQRTAAES